MDLTSEPSTKADLQMHESQPNNTANGNESLSTVSDYATTMQPNSDSTPPSLESRVCLVEESPEAVRTNEKPPLCPCRCACITTNEARHAKHDSRDIARVGDVDPFGERGLDTDRMYSDMGYHSGASSPGPEPIEKPEVPEFFLSEDGDETRRKIDELAEASPTALDGKASQSTERRSKIPREDILAPWTVSSLDKSEISPNMWKPKPSSGDISDLGDRAFHQTQHAINRKYTNPFTPVGSQDHLDLQDRFFEALVRPHEEKKGFFPRARLSILVNEDCVFHELNGILSDTHHPSQITTYSRKVCDEIPQHRDPDDNRPPKIKAFKKIFAILVFIEKTASISKFLEENVNDLDLPLVKVNRGQSVARFDLRRKHHQGQVLECFRNWSQSKIRAFEEWQWVTVAPFFHRGSRKDVRHFPLQDSIMLSFIEDSRRNKKANLQTVLEGGYGRVFKVNIHPDHHNFNTKSQAQGFAVKRLNSQNRSDFQREVEILKMFSGDAHDHLISLLCTFEQFGIYHLIFPWAACDLNGFWQISKPKPSFDLKTVKWFAKQCEGIAHGLLKIQNFRTNSPPHLPSPDQNRYGRHGDLKPENILFFPDDEGGTLKISDFGLSDYSTASKSHLPKSRVATSMSYRPPECDIPKSVIGQSYDIWTLGCLYLEFITWLLGGWEFVKIFERERMSHDPMWYDMRTDTFFELVRIPSRSIAAMVKPKVTAFIQRLHAHPCCSEFLHDFMNMISLDVLIIKPTKSEERARHSSKQVYLTLATMLARAEKEDGYLCDPACWNTVSQTNEEAVAMDVSESVTHLMDRKVFREFQGPIQERPL